MLHIVLSVILLQGVGLSASIVPVKISRTALLAAYIFELGIRHAKGPSGHGLVKHFNSFILKVFDVLKIFQKCSIFRRALYYETF